MITAKCNRCGGIALGETFEESSAKINHAVGLSRGIKCGASYNQVKQVNTKDAPKEKPKDFLFTEHKDKKTETETFKKVDEKPKVTEKSKKSK